MTVEQAAGGGSHGISRPRIAAKSPALDTLEDQVLFVHRQQDGRPNHALDPNWVDLLGSDLQFSAASSYDQTFEFESISTGQSVSDLASPL